MTFSRFERQADRFAPVAILLIGGTIGVIMIGIILAITSANDIVSL